MGASIGPWPRPWVDWIGESRNLHQWFVAELCTHALFIKGFLTLKLVELFIKKAADYSVFTSISLSREIQRGGR